MVVKRLGACIALAKSVGVRGKVGDMGLEERGVDMYAGVFFYHTL